MTDIVERLRKRAPNPLALGDREAERRNEADRKDGADEIERLRKRERRLAARVKQLHDIIQADRGPDFYIPAPDEAAA